MNVKASIRPYFRLLLYVAAVVLINVVGITLFFRLDLTKNGVYSLSKVSKSVVATLSEPLTINVFFTKNLPAPHNGTERYLRDLLEEYALNGNRFFNYKFYDVSPESESLDASAAGNRKLAADYGVHPVQIQIVENDEVKFKNAYMGLVIIHGDVVERIPAITSTAGLEYKLTTAIQKLNNKISALLALKDKIHIKLILSRSMSVIAPYMGLNQLPQLPDEIKAVVDRLNTANYGALAYETIDPATPADQDAAVKAYHIRALEWPAIAEANIAPGRGVIGLIMEHDGKSIQLPLLSAIQIPILGTRYQLAEAGQLEEIITAALESIVNINEDLGLITSHGSLSAAAGPQAQQGGGLGNFSRLVSGTYSLKRIDLGKEDIPAGLKSVVIARPTQPFSDAELYQIDQALMRGTNLLVFVDAFEEVMPQQNFGMRQGPEYRPLNTGLDKLLNHYGVRVEKAYVLDENCYSQQVPQSMGGGERKIYFAPMIQNKHINNRLEFMKNIRGLIAVKISPLSADPDALKRQGATADIVFSSSDRSWEMKDNINLNPMFMAPPQAAAELRSYPLGYLLGGRFTSYFSGKPVPARTQEKPAGETPEADGKQAEDTRDMSMIQGSGGFIEKGQPAQIFLLAASEMIRDNVLDADDNTPNGTFIMNAIDALNGRSDVAAMRGKQQQFNPLDETTAATKALIKWANIAGLPVMVVLFGIAVWIRRSARRKHIQADFAGKTAL
ncbi:MAG: Gldg family protein [Pseudomonadota bacterium]